ncbi:hypothetical protein ACHAPG_011470 [Botrytis cinerea]
MAYGWVDNARQVSLAFAAADSIGFKLFYSFDYAGNGPWPKADVIQFIENHASDGSYYHYNGQPFISTFEGPDSSDDWIDIKAQTGCFFVPDWSSIGAGPALAKGVADGLFSWAAWRWGDWRMNTYSDAAYNISLAGLPYMMPVSPWFYTNLPGYDKNWLWSSDDLWFDRWQEVWSFQPEWVEILTWNDFGESHYIGPLDEKQFDLFNETNGKAPFNYVEGMPHDAWGLSLPYLIDTYKNGVGAIDNENLYVWHRLSPATACNNDFTTANTASQLQIEFLPWDVVTDRVFFSALLIAGASYTVTIGGKAAASESFDWTSIPHTGTGGLYHGSASFNGLTGAVQVCLEREEIGQVLCVDGGIIATDCSSTAGYTNWNAFTAFKTGEETGGESGLNLSDQKCIEGFGTNDFNTICVFTCGLGYCPPEACTCAQMGTPPKVPDVTGLTGYSANGMIEYSGLCAFACLYGFCGFKNNTVCVDSPTTLYIPIVSPFNAPACTGGSGEGDFTDLCNWSCQYGYCPISSCTCDTQGDLVVPPPQVSDITATFVPIAGIMAYDDLCTFTCSRGHCPDVCTSNLACTSGSGEGNIGGLCRYSCGYNFCPEPCSCLTYGTEVSPPSEILGVVGYGTLGVDSATYDTICNFTCTHGYCPAGACSYDDTNIVGSLTFPSVNDLEPFQSSILYNTGDSILFDTPDESDLFLNLDLIGTPVVWDDIDCSSISSESAFGDDGDTLGCINAGVSFLFYSAFESDSSDQISTARRSLSSKFSFQTHSEWQPVDNCTTHCMLRANALSDTWTSVGNGTYRGIYHELHFIHNDNVFGHKAVQGGSSKFSQLNKRYSRWIDGKYVDLAPLEYEWWRKSPIKPLDTSRINSYGAAATSDFVGNSVADAVAYSNNTRYCLRLPDGSTPSLDGSHGIINISQDESINDPSSAEQALANCDQFNGTVGSATITCAAVNLTQLYAELLEDPDGTKESWVWPVLSTRTIDGGASEAYRIENYADTRESVIFNSATYPTGNGGRFLNSVGDTHVFALASRSDCTSVTIIDNAPLTGRWHVEVDAEHIIERQTIPFFMSFIQNPEIDVDDGLGYQSVPIDLGRIPFATIRDYMARPYYLWAPSDSTNAHSLFDDLADSLGSSTVPQLMTNLQRSINIMKARVWNSNINPIAQDRLDKLKHATIANTRETLQALREGMAVFNYLNDATVQGLLTQIHQRIYRNLRNFDSQYNSMPGVTQVVHSADLWEEFIKFWMQRMQNHFSRFANNGISQLRLGWQARMDANTNNDKIQETGEAALADINALGAQIATVVTINMDPFLKPSN